MGSFLFVFMALVQVTVVELSGFDPDKDTMSIARGHIVLLVNVGSFFVLLILFGLSSARAYRVEQEKKRKHVEKLPKDEPKSYETNNFFPTK